MTNFKNMRLLIAAVFFPVAVVLIAIGGLLFSTQVLAEPWQDLVQPPGYLARLWTANGTPPPVLPPAPTPVAGVNYICAQWDTNEIPGVTDPFDNGTQITQINPNMVHLVRVYTAAAGSTKNGAWMMYSQDVRGLTAAQLRDRFALPTVPDTIVSVDIPISPTTDQQLGPKYGLWTGIAGPIWTGTPPPGFYWGFGGAEQVRVIADFNGTDYFPDYIYALGNRYHDQPIGVQALLYEPMAGSGNAQQVANYLDQFIPVTYSDLYTVYTDLDYLNWNNPAVNTNQDLYTCYFRQALRSMSPDRYEALLFVAMRSGLLFSNALLEQHMYTCCCGDDSCCGGCSGAPRLWPRLWIYGIGECGENKKQHCLSGFDYSTGGIVCAADWQPCNNLTVGAAVGGLYDSIKWDNGGGSALDGDLKLGAYMHYAPSCFFIDGVLSGGWRWGSARRSIVFNAIDSFSGLYRCAHSNQKGNDLEARVQVGFDLEHNNWSFIPLARVSYFANTQKPFQEYGADSLDLVVGEFKAGTLRAYVGAEFMGSFELPRVCLVPNIHAAWACDVALDNRVIMARLQDLDGCFAVNAKYAIGNRGIVGASLDVQCAHGFTTFGRYDAEIRKNFVANTLKLGFVFLF